MCSRRQRFAYDSLDLESFEIVHKCAIEAGGIVRANAGRACIRPALRQCDCVEGVNFLARIYTEADVQADAGTSGLGFAVREYPKHGRPADLVAIADCALALFGALQPNRCENSVVERSRSVEMANRDGNVVDHVIHLCVGAR
jgi:hypothetical protein